MHYQEYPPGPRLAPLVDRLWTLSGSAGEMAGETQPVLPDGRCELIVHFGDPFDRATDGSRFERQANVLFAGQLTRQLLLRPSGAAAVLGIRFHPFGAAAFIDEPQYRLAGETPAVTELAPRLGRLLGGVRSVTDDPVRAVPIVRRILEHLVRPERVDPRIRVAAAAVTGARGLVSIDALAEQAGMSRRHLERRFLETVGLPPKRLARITRFQAALQTLQYGGARGGAATAAQFGYADQPHFIREFRELAGCTPSEHLLQQAALTGFFITKSRRLVP